MVVLAVAVRIHNVVVFPELRAPDGFGHFTYIWYLAALGRVPSATSGWSFFHPPLYYALMAGFWRVFDTLDPVTRLQIGTGFVALLGLVHAGVSYAFVRRRFPNNPVLQLAAPGFVLFLPVQLYTAGYLGNEALNAILCSLSLLVLLWVLERPVWTKAALLGLCAGLAMLTKFTAIAIVAGAYATIGLRSLLRRDFLGGARVLTVMTAVMLSVCGWFYVRNIQAYGTPFQMSRDTLAVRRIENIQTQGKRGILEYLLFDPMIFVQPQWPRGLPLYVLNGNLPPNTPRSALRESVWTGLFANTFFDAVGGQVIPPTTVDVGSLRAGQLLLALAIVPTLLVLLGLATTLRSLWQSGWSDPDVAMLICFAAMLAIFIYGTKSVPMHAAVKATYLSPAIAMFGFWFAHGLDRLRRSWPRCAAFALVSSALLAVVSVTVFTLGVIVGRGYLGMTWKEAAWQNLYGVVAYAGGDREQARKLFEASAANGWHLGCESLATMELEDGQPLEALSHLRSASKFQSQQSFGLPEERRLIEHTTQAEYRNSMAVIYYELGNLHMASVMIRESLNLDDSIPESSYDQGVVYLTASLTTADPVKRRAFVEHAEGAFGRTLTLDPAFHQAWTMKAVAAARSGQCDVARAVLAAAATAEKLNVRSYPLQTGTGDMHTSGLHRRRHIEKLPAQLRIDVALAQCSEAPTDDR